MPSKRTALLAALCCAAFLPLLGCPGKATPEKPVDPAPAAAMEAAPANPVALGVNGYSYTRSEFVELVNMELARLTGTPGEPRTLQAIEAVKQDVIRRQVGQLALLDAALKNGHQAGPEDVKRRLDGIAVGLPAGTTIDDLLASRRVSRATMEKVIARTLSVEAYTATFAGQGPEEQRQQAIGRRIEELLKTADVKVLKGL